MNLVLFGRKILYGAHFERLGVRWARLGIRGPGFWYCTKRETETQPYAPLIGFQVLGFRFVIMGRDDGSN